MWKARLAVAYGFGLGAVSVFLRAVENQKSTVKWCFKSCMKDRDASHTNRLTWVDIIEYGCLNVFTMDLLYTSRSAQVMNFVKLVEILVGFVMVFIFGARSKQECHTEQFDDFFLYLTLLFTFITTQT